MNSERTVICNICQHSVSEDNAHWCDAIAAYVCDGDICQQVEQELKLKESEVRP